MANTTTLITFLVRTPPRTRSVDLYGSWDNFASPCAMTRDSRLGSEHWSGCHNFSNIICDGRPGVDVRPSRKGALRMGGTYWYYYKLNDEIEFHNSAEQSTTACPMLPGQLVNVLEMPFSLSRNPRRNASTDSTSSELRTLNPADKYLNPRPVPTPPKASMMRVMTSPNMPQYSHSTGSSPVNTSRPTLPRSSSGDNVSSSGVQRLLHKASLDTITRSGQALSKTGGLRQAIRALRTGRSPSPDMKLQRPLDRTTNDDIKFSSSAPQTPEIRSDAASLFESSPIIETGPMHDGLLLRNAVDHTIPKMSFLEHRKERSRSRSRSRSPAFEPQQSKLNLCDTHSERETSRARSPKLGTVVEVASPEMQISLPDAIRTDTSAVDLTRRGSLQLEKRLPTLPNTPSSAYPPTLNTSPLRHLDLENLQSHFSTTTIDTRCHLDSILVQDTSRFSEWSTSSDLASPSSESVVEDSIPSPTLVDSYGFDSIMQASGGRRASSCILPSTSNTSIASAVSTAPSTSHNVRDDTRHGQTRTSGEHRTSFVYYRLPEVCAGSETTIKPFYRDSDESISSEKNTGQVHYEPEPQTLRAQRDSYHHSDNMQRLLNDLSYLSRVIIE